MAAKKIRVLYYGSAPLTYRGPGFYKFISTLRKDSSKSSFTAIINEYFNAELFSWTKRINYKISEKHVYIIDALPLIFNLIKKSIDKDILIVPGYPALLELIILILVSKLKRIPIIVRETHWYWPKTRISKLLWYPYYNLLKFVNGIICPGKAAYQYWRKLGFRNIHIVHFYALESIMSRCNSTHMEELRRRYKIPNKNNIVILYLGRLIKKKGVDIVVKAFAKLIREAKNTHAILIVAGDGPEKETLLKLTKKFNMENKIMFIGPIPEDEKECLYKLADVFVYTPIITEIPEEWPIAPLEAMSVGIPTIISTAVGSIPDIAGGIIIVKHNDEHSLKHAMIKCIYDERFRDLMSRKALEIYKKITNENIIRREILEALLKIIKSVHKDRFSCQHFFN